MAISDAPHVAVPASPRPNSTVCWETWHGVNPADAIRAGIDPMAHCTLEPGHLSPHNWDPAYHRLVRRRRPAGW